MPRKVLVVDDEPEILEMTAAMLRKRDYEVFTALNGALALEQIKRQRPDIILADVLMPEMDGYTFYKELKRGSLTADIPVLIVTGRGKMEDSFKGLGADGFIVKPFSPEQLVEEIEHILLASQNRQQVLPAGVESVRKKVLAVGQDNFILESMAHQAERAGYQMKIVQTAADAIAEAVKYLPEIIFVDVQLEDMAAADLIDVFKRLPQSNDKPIVGYCYYSTDDLGEPKVRQRILKINELSNRIMLCGATEYMGRYTPQIFVKTLIAYLNKNNDLDIRTSI
ncbi:MAG: response regulator [Candidatus Omnitrophota bacterium]